MNFSSGKIFLWQLATVLLLLTQFARAEANLTLNGESGKAESSRKLRPSDELNDVTDKKSPQKKSIKKHNKWDKNGNGLLEPTEREAMIDCFYERYDKNGDEIIDEYEKSLILKDLETVEREKGISGDAITN